MSLLATLVFAAGLGFPGRADLQPAAAWAATGSIITARYAHGSVLLSNDAVLVFGGNVGTGAVGTPTATAARYNPATGEWSAATSMGAARFLFARETLADGRVFACGGLNAAGAVLNTAETYDPETGLWTATAGTMTSGRIWHTATLLNDGRVLITGGSSGNGSNPLKTAELFDPTTGLFAATGTMASSIGRTDHTATKLADGRVLVIGGDDFASLTALAEIWTPATGLFTSPGSTTVARTQQSALLLPNGKVLIFGGRSGTWAFASSAELFDPSDNSFTPTGSMSTARTRHVSVLLPTGNVLTMGGYATAPGGLALATTEVYSVALGTWSAGPTMTAGREWAAATVTSSGRVLISGGGTNYAQAGLLSSSELLSSQYPGRATINHPVEACGACTCTGTTYGGAALTANCGRSGCGSDGKIYSCADSTWTNTQAACTVATLSCVP